jgi:hypothetical protein
MEWSDIKPKMKAHIALPSVERLREAFGLDPSIPNGLRWKTKASRNTIVGSPAGRRHRAGYWEVRLDKVLYKSSRIVYKLYNNGEDPGAFEVDHYDRNKDNNNGSNLLLATRAEQAVNRSVTGQSEFRNAVRDKRKPEHWKSWISSVTVDGKLKFIGYYSKPYEAALAAIVYKKANGIRCEHAPGGTM